MQFSMTILPLIDFIMLEFIFLMSSCSVLCHIKLSSGPYRHPKNVLFLHVRYATICLKLPLNFMIV